MTIEFIGMIHHRHTSEIHPPGPTVFDRVLPPTRQRITAPTAARVAA